MAIQNRRGQYRHFDPSKMVAGEWAVVQTGDPNASNGEAVYMAFEPGKVKRMATYEDMVDQIADAAEEATEEAVAQATAIATAAATTATNEATEARSYARGDTGTRTGEATDNAKYYSEQAASSASTATTKASEAASSASSASTSATSAASSASTATTKATEAATSASTATTKATAAANSAAEAAASAALLSDYCLWFKDQSVSATTGDILTINNAKITADHIVSECVWGDPSAITSDITWTTSAGSLVLNGTCASATTATILLIRKTN